MPFSSALQTALRRTGKVSWRVDLDLPPQIKIEVTDPASIPAGGSLEFTGGINEAVPSFDPSANDVVSATEGSDFDRTDSLTAIAADITSALNANAWLTSAEHIPGTNTLFVRGRGACSTLFASSTLAGITLTPSPTAFDDPGAGVETLSFVSADQPIGDRIPVIVDISIGEQNGEPVTREYTAEASEIELQRNPLIREINRTRDLFRVSARIYLGALDDSRTWQWGQLLTGFVKDLRQTQYGGTYRLTVDSYWSLLATSVVAIRLINMHPLTAAQYILGDLGIPPHVSISEFSDSNRTHFVVTRAGDIDTSPDAWLTSENLEDQEIEDIYTLNPIYNSIYVLTPGGLQFRNGVRLYDRLPVRPVVEAQEDLEDIDDLPSPTDLLNEIALMMSGGFYVRPDGSIRFRSFPESSPPTVSRSFVAQWKDLEIEDVIQADKVVVRYLQSASNVEGLERTFVLSSPFSAVGSEVAVDLAWCNAVSELRTPAGASFTAGSERSAILTQLNPSVVLVSSPRQIASQALQSLRPVANIIFSFSVSGRREFIVTVSNRGSSPPPSSLGNPQPRNVISIGVVIVAGSQTILDTRIQVPVNSSVTRRYFVFVPPGGGTIYISAADIAATIDRLEILSSELESFFFEDDRHLFIANPDRGFCGSRHFYDRDTDTWTNDGALSVDDGRVAYLQINSRRVAVSGSTPTSEQEAIDYLEEDTRPSLESNEIVVIGEWDPPEGPNPSGALIRSFEFNRNILRNEDLYLGDQDLRTSRLSHLYEYTLSGLPLDDRWYLPKRLRAEIATTYNEDGAVNGRQAFGSGTSGAVDYFYRIAEDVYGSAPSQRDLPDLPKGSPVYDIFGQVADVTIPVYVAKTIWSRFKDGAPQVNLKLPLEYADLEMWEIVEFHAPDLDLPGINGVSDGETDSTLTGVRWEVTRIRIETDSVDVVLTFFDATTGFPTYDPVFSPLEPIPPRVAVDDPSDNLYILSGRMLALYGTADLRADYDEVEILDSVSAVDPQNGDALSLSSLSAPSGSDRRLFVAVATFSGGGTVSGVTWGGVAMTPEADETDGDVRLRVFSLDETGIASASGTSFSFTNSGANEWLAVARFVAGAATMDVGSETGADPTGRSETGVAGQAVWQVTANRATTTPTIIGTEQRIDLTGSVNGSLFEVHNVALVDGEAETNLDFGSDGADKASVLIRLRP